MGEFKLFAAAHKQCEAQRHRALGDDAYSAAIQRGTDLSLDQAIAYAFSEQAATPNPAPPLGPQPYRPGWRPR